MKSIETIEDFKKFIGTNRDKLLKNAVRIEDLPADDAWIQDDEWEEIYKKEATKNGEI